MRNRFSSSTALVSITVLVALILGYSLWHYYMDEPWTRDGRVRADIVNVAPDVSGFLTDIRVQEDQLVHAGDILFTLDKSRYAIALKQAEALTLSRKAEMDQAEDDAKRYKGMRAESYSAIDRDLKTTAAAVAAAHYEQAKADEDLARLNLERTEVKAMVDGYVSNFNLRVGNYLTAGHPIFVLVASDSYHVIAYMEETKLRHITLGDKARVHLMGHTQELNGHVESIARGIVDRERSDTSGTLANVNPTFNWVRLAQRIPVRIALDDVPADMLLVAGQTATVNIKGAH